MAVLDPVMVRLDSITVRLDPITAAPRRPIMAARRHPVMAGPDPAISRSRHDRACC
jgi:hypothetical protein